MSALGMVNRVAVLAHAADELQIVVTGLGVVGGMAGLTIAAEDGHADATRIMEYLGVDTYIVNEYSVRARVVCCAIGEVGSGQRVSIGWYADGDEQQLNKSIVDIAMKEF